MIINKLKTLEDLRELFGVTTRSMRETKEREGYGGRGDETGEIIMLMTVR